MTTNEPRFSTHEEIRDWLKDRINELLAEYADEMCELQREADEMCELQREADAYHNDRVFMEASEYDTNS